MVRCSTQPIGSFPPATGSCECPSRPGRPSERATRRTSTHSNCFLLLANRFVSSHALTGPSVSISSFGRVCLPIRVNCIQTTVGFGIGLTKIGSSATHLHAFGEAFVVDAHTLRTSASVYLQSAFVRLDGFEWSDKRAQLTRQQRQMIKTLMPKVLSAAVHSATRQLLDVR